MPQYAPTSSGGEEMKRTILEGRSPSRINRQRRAILIWLALIFFPAIGIIAYRALAPADRVSIIVPVPSHRKRRSVCLAAETEQGPQALLWSLHKVGPFEMHLADCVVSGYDPGRPGGGRRVPRAGSSGGRPAVTGW